MTTAKITHLSAARRVAAGWARHPFRPVRASRHPELLFESIYARGDRMLRAVHLAHVLIALVLASVHGTWGVTLAVAAGAIALFGAATSLFPRTLFTRCLAGITLQAFVALHGYQMHGLMEMHFFFFIAVTLMIVYQDARCLWPGVLLALALHGALRMFYGDAAAAAGGARFLLHTSLMFAQAVLCSRIAGSLRRQTLREAAQRARQRDSAAQLTAHLEQARRSERRLKQHTAELKRAQQQLKNDLARRAHAETALRESESRLQSILDNSPAMIFVKDLRGRMLLVNRRFEALFGLDREAVLGKTDHDLFPADAADTFRANDQQVLRAGQAIESEEVAPHPDGTFHTYLSVKFPLRGAGGKPYAVCGIATDITDRKRREEEIRYVTAHARCLLWHGTVCECDANPVGLLWDTDVASEAAAQEFLPLDLRPGERYTQAWYRHRLPEDQERTDQTNRTVLRSGVPHFATEFRCRGRDGAVRWFSEQVHIEPLSVELHEASRRRWRVVGVCTEITERKQAEQRLRAAYQKEHRVAETLQRAMLQPPARGQFPHLDVAMRYEAALDEARVGGDFYDAFALPGGRTALIVGDIAGKGLEAAERTAEVKYALRTFLRASGDNSPADALRRVNALLSASSRLDGLPAPLFATLALVVLCGQTGEGVWAAAGAEPPMILRQNGTVETLPTGGLPLGVLETEAYGQHPFRLEAGETIALFTDGLTEARAGKDLLGPEGVADLIAARQEATVEELAASLLEGARAFCAGPLQDDACLLLARRR